MAWAAKERLRYAVFVKEPLKILLTNRRILAIFSASQAQMAAPLPNTKGSKQES